MATEKKQVIAVCVAFICAELAIYIWFPYWQTILITLAVNATTYAFVLEKLDRHNDNTRQ